MDLVNIPSAMPHPLEGSVLEGDWNCERLRPALGLVGFAPTGILAPMELKPRRPLSITPCDFDKTAAIRERLNLYCDGLDRQDVN